MSIKIVKGEWPGWLKNNKHDLFEMIKKIFFQPQAERITCSYT